MHGKSERARTRYPEGSMRFCWYHGKNPDELIEIRKEDRRNAEHTSEMKLKEFAANTNSSGNFGQNRPRPLKKREKEGV